MSENKELIVYVVSDSVGETADLVVRAAVSQFNGGMIDNRRIPYVDDVETIKEVVTSAKEVNGIIAFTLVIPELRNYLLKVAEENNVPVVDIMGPMMEVLEQKYQKQPKLQPGLVHRLDEDYFRKIEAIEFAVKYDDGRDPRGIMKADVVLIGVSRTSKTPLSMYLAHKRYKVANVPLVPEVAPPDELFTISPKKCIGLTIEPIKLNEIRAERLKALGLTSEASYANYDRILSELEYAESIMKKIKCPIIDVSRKAVEETANIIIDILKRGE